VRALSSLVRGAGVGVAISAVVAVIVFWIAYDDAGYELASRATLAIAVWWAVILGLALRLFPTTRLPRASAFVSGSIVLLAAWSLASVVWAPSAENAFNEFNRVSLYLGTYVFAVLAASRGNLGRWADGLAVAIASVGMIALVGRLFPGVFSDRELVTFLPSAATRLSFPLGYWNGLGIFVALGVPLLLRLALVPRSATVRGLALAPNVPRRSVCS
jgi:hypothetical protein